MTEMTPEPTAGPSDAPAAPQVTRWLEELTRENRRLRRQANGTLVVVALLLGLAAALVYTAASHGMPGFVPQVIEAREYLLRDSEGRVRGAWGSDAEGAIRFVLQDHRTRRNVKLNLLDDGTAGLTFADSTGNPRMIIATLPDETTNLVLVDGRGVTRTVMSLSKSGASTLVFADNGGRVLTSLGVDRRGQPVLTTGRVEIPDEEPADSGETEPAKPEPKRRRN